MEQQNEKVQWQSYDQHLEFKRNLQKSTSIEKKNRKKLSELFSHPISNKKNLIIFIKHVLKPISVSKNSENRTFGIETKHPPSIFLIEVFIQEIEWRWSEKYDKNKSARQFCFSLNRKRGWYSYPLWKRNRKVLQLIVQTCVCIVISNA